MNERWIDLGERRVRYLEAGSGPPVIFAAGLGISADFYRHNLETLARAGLRALAPDLPGFGKTRGPFLGADVPALARHLSAFSHALGIADAGWIGHSLGCQPLLHIAADQPHLVRAFVLAGPTGGYDRRKLNQARALASAAVHEPWPLMKAVIRDYLRLSPFTYIGAWIKAAQDDPLAKARLVRQPALILVGTQDRVPGPEFLEKLSAFLRTDVVRLPGGNHGLPIDAQEQFEQAVVQFFAQA